MRPADGDRSVEGQTGEKKQVTLSAWDPARLLRRFDTAEVRYSRGFLRCRPEKWFPGFGMQWMPLAHSLGVELKLVEAKPVIGVPRGFHMGFVGSIDDEPVGLFLDEEAATALHEAVVPGAAATAREVVCEYLARRLLTSLAISWSGPESSLVRFEPDMNPHNMREVGAVKLTAALNGNQVVVWILVGKIVVEKMDGLWRRQLHSTSGQSAGPLDIHLEVAHLTVPPSILSDYLKPGVTFDLEVPVSDTITLVSEKQPWLPARLAAVDGHFAIETLPGPAAAPGLPAGTTRLSFEFGVVNFDPLLAAEMSQPGAVYDTGIALSERVQIVVNGEQAGEAVLRTYQNRFVVTVL